MVADRCECAFGPPVSGMNYPKKARLSTLLARLNDRAIMLLEQIFLDCHDSYSAYRFAVFLSSMYDPMTHKFVIGDKVTVKPGVECLFDIGVYSRSTEKLVAVGMQNNEVQRATSNRSLRKFLATVKDLYTVGIKGAYYSSSYGYADSDPGRLARKAILQGESAIEIRFFDYRNKIFLEIKSK
jgi:hypothetical protein